MDSLLPSFGKRFSVSRLAPSRATDPRHQRERSVWVMSLNLTPMIDIVFLLLCYFLMMSQFRTPEGVLGARLPVLRGGVSAEIPRTPIRVRFQRDTGLPARCRVTIDRFTDSPLEIHLLAGRLRQIREGVPGFDADTPVHLLADDDVAWDHVVNAYNAALAAEYMKIFFAGSP